MSTTYQFESERLGFRLWTAEDRIPFSRMNANKNVMQYFPDVLHPEESDKFVTKIMNHFDEHGYGLWAVELKAARTFIGFIGFYTATFTANFTPCVEIGWRLDEAFWNSGYATEGAKQCLDYGFMVLGLDEVYSFTSQLNVPSIRVMKKIGLKMHGSFCHPAIEKDSPLRPHALYKIDKQAYNSL